MNEKPEALVNELDASLRQDFFTREAPGFLDC